MYVFTSAKIHFIWKKDYVDDVKYGHVFEED
jgi:hypothetical protein